MTILREPTPRTVARTGYAVAIFACLAVGLFLAAARAQTIPSSGQDTTRRAYLTLSAAYNGYSAGFDTGARDRDIGPGFRSQFGESFLRASTGYTTEMGSFADYQSAFRMAFTRGYSEARAGRENDHRMNVPPAPPEPFVQSAPYVSGSSGLESGLLGVATANGYDTGFTVGGKERSSGAGYGYRDEPAYRAATDGYAPSLGAEDRYQVLFRQAFSRGYSDGFNGRGHYMNYGRPE